MKLGSRVETEEGVAVLATRRVRLAAPQGGVDGLIVVGLPAALPDAVELLLDLVELLHRDVAVALELLRGALLRLAKSPDVQLQTDRSLLSKNGT